MNRAMLSFKPGELIACSGKEYIILSAAGPDSVLGRCTSNGATERLGVEHLSAPVIGGPEVELVSDLQQVKDADWCRAQERFELIRPFLRKNKHGLSVQEKKARAKEVGVHLATIYRWIERYETTGMVSSLLDGGGRGGRCKRKLDERVEGVIQTVIHEFYLSKQRPSVAKTLEEVARRCRLADLEAPHYNTVRSRILLLSEKHRGRARLGAGHARDEFDPMVEHFPNADWPLSVVQIDHSLLDIIVLDEVERAAVGRPWLTLAIDVFSRMVVGFYLSLDPPGAVSVGMCLFHAIAPKRLWLAKRNISLDWPCYGLMDVVHADNAKEFRGNMLRRATQEYGVDLQWRRVRTPHYGGHIERMMGTVAEEIHCLPGTTFSGPHKRLDYDSAGKAQMTLPELEAWLTNFILGKYHQRVHGTLGTSPLQRYNEGINGTARRAGRGLPTKVADEERLRLNFLPCVTRTVQQYGVLLDDIHYYDEVLRPFINVRDQGRTKAKKEFFFRRDPRDISVIYFYHPELKLYRSVPYRDTWRPAISLWELRCARRALRDEGRKNINEMLIFATVEKMREIEHQAGQLTMKVRRERQRRLTHRSLAVHQTAMQPNAVLGAPLRSALDINRDATSIPMAAPEAGGGTTGVGCMSVVVIEGADDIPVASTLRTRRVVKPYDDIVDIVDTQGT